MKNHIAILATAILLAGCNGSKGNATQTASPQAEATQQLQFTANADSLYRYVEQQVELGPRVPGSEAHRLCGDMILTHLQRCGIDSVAQQYATATTFTGQAQAIRNITGSINPSATNRVLLLAHYDTRPWADNDPDPGKRNTPIDGANDGASGVAVLMEVARTLGRSLPDSVGIDLLFTDLEDSGQSDGDEDTWCLGTQQWAKQMPYTTNNRPKFGILLDMVGGQDARFHREYFSQQHAPALVDRVWAAAREAGFGDKFINSAGGAVVDDHLHLNQAGIPCIDIIESINPHTGTFNPTWHTTADNISAIDRNTLRAVAQTVINVVTNGMKTNNQNLTAKN